MKSVQVTLMLTWDWCKMVITNITMISKSCVPYPRSTSLIVPYIASPLQNQCRKLTHYLRNLSLAHPITESFIQRVIKGTKLGYLLSRPVPVPSKKKFSSMMNVLISHNRTNCDLKKFWKLENMCIEAKKTDACNQMTNEMQNFVESSISKESGKYVSTLPWKENCLQNYPQTMNL